ncbi:MAG: hypothetical protein ABJB16_08325 [Saprospiraceae bacterium]
MNKRTLLWTNLTLWHFLCVGMVFDMYVCANNWKTGEIEEIKNLQLFFHRTHPGGYFMMMLALHLVAIKNRCSSILQLCYFK